MLKSVITAACIGVLGGFWIALVDGSIEIFQNYVDGVWRYQIEFNSAAEILVGAVIGVLAGANIRLALDPERADGFVSGALVGLAVGILLALAQIAFVALSALLQIYDVEYGFLLTRFSGILAAAVFIGALAGLLKSSFSLAAPLPSGVAGALVAIAFMMPIVMGAALTIPIADWGAPVGGAFSSTYLSPHLPVLLACAGTGAIVAAVAGSRVAGPLQRYAHFCRRCTWGGGLRNRSEPIVPLCHPGVGISRRFILNRHVCFPHLGRLAWWGRSGHGSHYCRTADSPHASHQCWYDEPRLKMERRARKE